MAPIDDSEKEQTEVIDSPIVVQLKKLDDDYLELHRAYEKEEQELRRQFSNRQKPLLEQRTKDLLVSEGSEDPATGTPALKGFWLKALSNHPQFDGEIEEWDEPVLEYLRDIMTVDLDPNDSTKGYRLKFLFAENPYFTNAILSKEYHSAESSPYTGEVNVSEINGCTINWKDGKDVTTALVKKQKETKKGKNNKSVKQESKEEQEPRTSFLRSFFRSLKEGSGLPESIHQDELERIQGEAEEGMDEEEMVEAIMSNDYDMGCAIRFNIIPFAVRWYTGEASPEGDEDDEEEEEEEEEDDMDEE
ncbi:unnamed protein product [Polarella glacialis]|uniref:Nucleosome assembly protein n=1 Tax=Polarella glacialis TaxID=89957 RepID=A0A813GFT3_POLGL|nr:unnamed protein product [Polarella glacialis]CAE8712035.1 unnamed protein product [Polarella glacialis]